MILAYFQGGPMDLTARNISRGEKPPSRIFIAHLERNPILDGCAYLSEQDKIRMAETTKHEYELVGGYQREGWQIVTYAYAGPATRVVADA